MAITNYLVHFKTEATYELNKDQLRNDAVAFVKDATIIHTHGTDYYCGSGPVALKSELPDTSNLASKDEIPDVSGLATKSEVNDGLANKANVNHTHEISNITGLQDALDDKADASALTAHTSNTSNPHSITKKQVGLGNVDNTSDIDKPISTATQTALDLKQNAADNSLNTTNKTVVGAINEINSKLYSPTRLDVSTLFADSATITSELSSQIAAYGKNTATDFPFMYAGASIGNIKPIWIRTSGDITNFMCIADNKIWYFEIQGTTVQRASLAIS